MKLDVRIERLAPMRVAVFRAVSDSPEHDAWEKLCAWAEPKGLLGEPERRLVFGFNNPSPSPGRKEYGYEFWLAPLADPETCVDVKDFPGGWYAVTTCRLPDAGETWKALWEWVQASEYCWRHTHELERLVNPLAPPDDLVLDLCLPVESPAGQ